MEYGEWYRSRKSSLCRHTPNIPDLLLELDAKGLVNVTKKAEIEGKTGPILQCEALYDHLLTFRLGRVGDIIYCLEASENTHAANLFKECLTGAVQESGSSPSAVRPVWHEVGEPVDNFTGRVQQLVTLHQMMTESRSTESSRANLVCICGRGGIGKTSLARKYAHKHKRDYGGNVIWINAETLQSMRSSFTGILRKHFRVQVDQSTTNEEVAEMVYERLQNRKVLIVFDNVEDAKHLEIFRPKVEDPHRSVPHVLLTSQKTDLIPVPKNLLKLVDLSSEESFQLIKTRLTEVTQEAADTLSATLQGSPLAIQQAIAYITAEYLDPSQTIPKYLQEFETSKKELLDDERFKDHDDYSKTTFTACLMTLRRISVSSPDGAGAIRVVNALAYLSPDNISVQFVAQLFADGQNVEKRLKRLATFSMIDCTQGKVNIHRLVQLVIRIGVEPRIELEMLKLIVKLVTAVMDKRKFTDTARECVSHGLHLFPFQFQHVALMRESCRYLSALCSYLVQYGHFSDCLHVAERAAALYEAEKGKGHVYTILMKLSVGLANTCMFKDEDVVQFLRYLEDLLATARDAHGHTHEISTHVQENLGFMYAERGHYDKAVRLYDELIAIMAQKHGENDRRVLSCMDNKAVALCGLGRLDEALELHQRVYAAEVGMVEPNELNVATAKYGMADVAHKKGELPSALRGKKEVYPVFKRINGEKHPHTVKIQREIESLEAQIAANP